MLSRTKFYILAVILSVSSCDNKPAKNKIENPLAGHAKALEKARDVEKQLLDAQQKTQDAIDKATN